MEPTNHSGAQHIYEDFSFGEKSTDPAATPSNHSSTSLKTSSVWQTKSKTQQETFSADLPSRLPSDAFNSIRIPPPTRTLHNELIHGEIPPSFLQMKQLIEKVSCYISCTDQKEMESLLSKQKVGTFLIRPNHNPNSYTLSFLSPFTLTVTHLNLSIAAGKIYYANMIFDHFIENRDLFRSDYNEYINYRYLPFIKKEVPIFLPKYQELSEKGFIDYLVKQKLIALPFDPSSTKYCHQELFPDSPF